MPIPAVGGAALVSDKGPMLIRMLLHGHSNRPFFHIVLTFSKIKMNEPHVEQLGTYDPMPNMDNQKLVSLNIERTRYWMGQGATFTQPVAKLLGLVGFLDIHPQTYIDAWRTRFKEAKEEAEAKTKELSKTEAGSASSPPSSSSS